MIKLKHYRGPIHQFNQVQSCNSSNSAFNCTNNSKKMIKTKHNRGTIGATFQKGLVFFLILSKFHASYANFC